MEDEKIVQLYWERREEAIPETAKKYGTYCGRIAHNILGNAEDAEECVNDTYLQAWKAMPPHRPGVLSTFLGKITRNLSFNRYQWLRAEKRGGGELPLVLDELAEIVSGQEDIKREMDRRELLQVIQTFLNQLPKKKRSIFLCRYWYNDSVKAIAERWGMKETAASMTLSRLRLQLREQLRERGFDQ